MKKIILCLAWLILLGCQDKGEQEEIANLEPPIREQTGSERQPENAVAEEEEDPLTAIVDGYQSITWWDLLSDTEWEYYQEINLAYQKNPFFKSEVEPPPVAVNPNADGRKVRIPGFVVGVDTDPQNFTKVKAFLFVPFQGACIHVPPPPTNQTIFVTVDEPIGSDPYTAYWVYGVISVEEGSNDIAGYSYTIAGDKLEHYHPE